MKKAIVVAAVALLVPSVALAGRAGHGGKSRSAPNVVYLLRGTLSGYTAANGATNGQVTITVAHANHHARSLKGQALTLPVSSRTKIRLEHKATTISDGDRGFIAVVAAKRVAAADLASTLQAATAKRVVDTGAPRARK